ncbi:CU044_2847 family protein [Streptomyces sp. CA-294286]|uniref:CU044_2847 family protein n=1 Tax=Streptomyces sp. CA-294286 TaxID=3240070 RepID=UPI003D8A18D9
MRFETADGAEVVVEVDRVAPGAKLVARGSNRLAQAGETFDGALQGIRSAADAALRVFREGPLRPDGVELEFGVKLTGEAGAVIAKTAVEGHITVKLSWSSEGTDLPTGADGSSAVTGTGASGTPGTGSPPAAPSTPAPPDASPADGAPAP